jgi:hypothetical protein
MHMADTPKTAQSTTSFALTGKPFGDMSGAEKITWIGKCLIMLITGGFAFPNIFVE